MSTPKRRKPTPAELAAFVHARTGNTITDLDAKAFRRAVGAWREWDEQIAAAWNFCDEADAERAEKLERVPFNEALRQLENSKKTVRTYWDEIFPLAPGGWMDRKINGFPRHEVQQMISIRSERATERAKKGAAARLAKAQPCAASS